MHVPRCLLGYKNVVTLGVTNFRAMEDYNDETIMPFGKHKGEKLVDVPDDYLLWFWGENKEAYKQQGGSTLGAYQHRLMDYISDSFTDLP